MVSERVLPVYYITNNIKKDAMIWKFLLLAFILIFVVITVLDVRKFYGFFVDTFSADDESIKQEFRGLLSRKDLYVMSLSNLVMTVLCLANLVMLCYIPLYGEPVWLTWEWIAGDIVVSVVSGVASFFINKNVFGIVAPIVIKAKRCTDFSGGERICYWLLRESDGTLIYLGVAVAALTIIGFF